MKNDSILIDGNMMFVWLGRNSTIVSWWCLIGQGVIICIRMSHVLSLSVLFACHNMIG